MKKYTIIVLIISTLIYYYIDKKNQLTFCNTYSLKIYKGNLYVKYQIRTNEEINPDFIEKVYVCRRYKVNSLDSIDKQKLERDGFLKNIDGEYYMKIGIMEIISERRSELVGQIFEKITLELEGDSDEIK